MYSYPPEEHDPVGYGEPPDMTSLESGQYGDYHQMYTSDPNLVDTQVYQTQPSFSS